MGSSVPGLLEGTPFHNDNQILSFKASGTISIGQVLSLQSAYTVQAAPTSSAGALVIGVALTSGTLYATISVICRGLVDVISDGAITAGHSLNVSTTTAGRVVDGGVVSGVATIRLVAISAATGAGQVIQALLE
jgi:hypothetical protein